MTKRRASRDGVEVCARLSFAALKEIEAAAEVAGVTRSKFIADAALARAREGVDLSILQRIKLREALGRFVEEVEL